jgi:hypothetical protein
VPAKGLDISVTSFEMPEIDLLMADLSTAKQEPEDVLPPLPYSRDKARRSMAPRQTPSALRRRAGRR